MDIKKNIQRAGIIGVNLLIVALIVLGIREKDKNRFSVQNENKEEVAPVDSSVSELQNEMATDRENKLRDLNNAPKEIKQEDTVTTNTTVAPKPVSAPKPAESTKTQEKVATPAPAPAPEPAKKADKKTKTS